MITGKTPTISIVAVSLRQELDIVTARQRARQIAALAGFGNQDQVRIATAVSEIARNCVQYGGGGRAEFLLDLESRSQSLIVQVADCGPGIAELDSVMSGAYRSATGMGIGLAGTQRLMDTFHLESAPGRGTKVLFSKYLPGQAARLTLADVHRMTGRLAQNRPTALPEEVLAQNHELLEMLESANRRDLELESRQAELRRLNSELEETNRGVVALYAELDEAAKALRQADELKSRFLSHVSHEFRTPCNSILGLTNLLLRRADGDLTSEQEKQVGFIRKGAQGLLEMVNDLLDLAKVEAGKTEIHLHRIEVPQLIGALRGMMRPLAVNDAVALIVEDPQPGLTIVSDEAKVGQILRNLISNALKFTESGEVRVATKVVGSEIQISVSDTGIGIAPQDQERIFQEFAQVHGPIQKKVTGTGLGLPLSLKLTHLLGGSLTISSSPGEGSTFTLTLPIGDVEEPRQPESGEGQSDSILIIDDEESARYVLRSRLRDTRYRILEASNGAEGAERARFERPALILLDLSMPVRSGFEVLDDLKSDPSTREIPVVIHTSRALTEADYDRLGNRHVAILPKGADPSPHALERIRTILNEPDLFAAEEAGQGEEQ